MRGDLQNVQTGSAEPAPPQQAPQCSSCSSAAATLYTDVHNRHIDSPGRWSLVECPRRGLTWLAPRPEPAELGAYYTTYYTHEDEADEGWLRRVLQRGLSSLLLGYEATELAASERAWARVFEHLLEPEVTLAGCLRALRLGGWLIIATPNPQSLGRRHFGRDWLHWDPPRHVQVFSPEPLRRMVESAGFQVRRLDTPSSTAHYVWQARRRQPNRRNGPYRPSELRQPRRQFRGTRRNR